MKYHISRRVQSLPFTKIIIPEIPTPKRESLDVAFVKSGKITIGKLRLRWQFFKVK